MDTTRFLDDLTRIPQTLDDLSGILLAGLDGLEGLPVARRVLLLGMGSSLYAAAPLARRARSQGLSVAAESASTEDLPAPADDLVVIAISATGGSAEVLHAATRYAGTGRLVAVTNRLDSPLAALADLVVPLHAGVEESGIACRTFRTTTLVLSEILRHYGLRDTITPSALARRAAESSQHLFDTRDDWLDDTARILGGPDGTWAMAPVERLASAQQSTLMMREVPRRPAYASETGDWSHVDVYLTKTLDYRALVFAGSRWDEPALEWMRGRGSTYVAVGGELPGASRVIRFPGDDEPLVAAISEVLVGELVAWTWFSETGEGLPRPA